VGDDRESRAEDRKSVWPPSTGLIVVAIVGVGMYAVFALLERRFTGWAFRADQSA
jgi:ABC-type nitrate/sulfonate/bicarbonate transport system permease component